MSSYVKEELLLYMKNRNKLLLVVAFLITALIVSSMLREYVVKRVKDYGSIPANELIEIIEEEKKFSESDIIADFMRWDSENFKEKYDRNELYEKDILYCDKNSWKYEGNAVDSYQEPDAYFNVTDITAIRFIRESYVQENADEEINDREVYIQCLDDCVISMFFQKKTDSQSGEEVLNLLELSFIKVTTEGEKVPESFYQDLENGYYQVRVEIQSEEWIESPDRTKAVCVSNGALPKHPSQIFVRYQDKIPDSVFRMPWECGIVGWIDDEHIVFYEIDMSGPLLIHLEANQIEEIKKKDDDYDVYGAKYEIQDNQLVCTCLGEKIYCWDIVKKNNDIHITKVN